MRLRRITAIAALVFVLTGCASSLSYDAATAAALQERVLGVTDSAAASDFPTALSRIAELRTAADEALARGDITQERHADIHAAADLVQADSETAIAVEQQRIADEEAAAAAAAEQQRIADEDAAAAAAEQQRIADEQAAAAEEAARDEVEKRNKDDEDKDKDGDD